MFRFISALLSLAATLAAQAAVAQLPARSTTTPPPAPASGLAYTSAFEGYRPYREPQSRPWREANAEAGSLGGHVGQLKASQGTSAGSVPGTPTLGESSAPPRKTEAPAAPSAKAQAPVQAPAQVPAHGGQAR